MTVICWDGHTLAGDRKRTIGGVIVPKRKVHKIVSADGRRFLMGCAGDSGSSDAYLSWARGKRKEPDLIDLEILAVDDDGVVWQGDQHLNFACIGKRPWAIGSGCDFALSAMAFGKTAIEAVRFAARFNNSCGLGVNWVRF